MKRRAILLALLTAAALCTGCGKRISKPSGDGDDSGSQAEGSSGDSSSYFDSYDDDSYRNPYPQVQNGDGEDARVVLDDGKVVVVTDDGSMIEQTDLGLEWNYLGGTVRMYFPLDWDDRFVIRGTSVYCKKCFAQQEFSGELFSIDFIRDTDMNSDPGFSALLGGAQSFYTVAIVPQQVTYDAGDADQAAEYQDMAEDLSGIFRSTSCLFTPGFTPIDLSVYTPAGESSSSKLFGSWAEDAQTAAGYTPKAIFRSRDSAFAYRTSDTEMIYGTFRINRNAAGYVWNTENWGDAGLVFAGGQVYRVTYYESEPMKLEFEPLFQFDQESPIGKNKFTYSSDQQEIYSTDEPDSTTSDSEN
ncbi:MAG: hypothetical protein IJ060_06590 [Oscillospiraceae bacterium]|nr:hypothetical protein [Oscillospiraceae bacterium]